MSVELQVSFAFRKDDLKLWLSMGEDGRTKMRLPFTTSCCFILSYIWSQVRVFECRWQGARNEVDIIAKRRSTFINGWSVRANPSLITTTMKEGDERQKAPVSLWGIWGFANPGWEEGRRASALNTTFLCSIFECESIIKAEALNRFWLIMGVGRAVIGTWKSAGYEGKQMNSPKTETQLQIYSMPK